MKSAILETYAFNGMEFVGAIDIDGPFLAETVGYFLYHRLHIVHMSTYPARDLGAKEPRQHLRELVEKEAKAFWKLLTVQPNPFVTIIPNPGS